MAEVGEGYRKRDYMQVLFTKYYQGNQIKDDMGDACGAYWEEQKCIEF
jgi:hypothetical protein